MQLQESWSPFYEHIILTICGTTTLVETDHTWKHKGTEDMWSHYLIITAFTSSFTAADNIILEKRPLGFKMCKQLCQRVSGCHMIKYIQANLSCHIADLHYQTKLDKQGISIFNITEAKTTNKNCLFGDIWMTSRSNIFQCVKSQRNHNNLTKDDTNYLNMTLTIYETCRKMYVQCKSGKTQQAMKLMFKLLSNDEMSVRPTSLVTDVLQHGCDLSLVSGENDTIVHTAAKYGVVNVIKCALLKHKVYIKSKNSQGMTPIMSAAENAQTNVFRFLLYVGSNLSTVDVHGNSILHLACRGGSLTVVKDILADGSVSIHSKSERGWTPLMTAVKHGWERIFKHLLEKGSIKSAVTNDGCNVLHIASSYGKVNLMKNIIRNRIAVMNSEDFIGRTPIMYAVLYHQKIAFHYLLNNYASLEPVDNNGNTIFHLICKGGDFEIAKALLMHVNKDRFWRPNRAGKTPLDLVDINNEKFLRLLTK